MSRFSTFSHGSHTLVSSIRSVLVVAVLFLGMALSVPSARAQGQLGWPQWMPIDGWEAAPFSVTAMYFFDPIHGVASSSYMGNATINYILRVGTPWRTSTMPSGIDSVHTIRFIQGKLYAAAHGSDVLVSSDSGKTWTSSGLGLTNANDVYADGTGKIRALNDPMKTFARIDTLHCIATGNGTMFVSSDGGLTWRTGVTGIDHSGVGAFADRCNHAYVCPFDSGTILTSGTSIRSTDSGNTWQTTSLGQRSSEGPQGVFGESGVVYCSFPERMYRSTDDGLTWKYLVTVNDAQQHDTVRALPHILFVFGPMGEHVILPWTLWKHTAGPIYVEETELWMTHTGGDDFLHSGVNMTDSNGMDLLENDTLNMPLELTSTCNAYSIPIPFHSDVDSMTEHVSILKDSLHDFAIIGPSTITLPRDKDVNFQLAYKPHNLVSKVVLQFDNHWHCSDWSETRTVIVTSLPTALIVAPQPITGSCKPVRGAAFLKLDSCQAMSIDSVHIPKTMSSRLRFDAPFPDTIRVGFNDSLFFTFDPTDTLATISDSMQIFAHFLGVDSAMVFWDFGLSGGTDSIPFSRFNRSIYVKLLAVPQVALVASDTVVSLHRTSFCERSQDTTITFSNTSCTRDTIVSALLTGVGYSMPTLAVPIFLLPDSSITIPVHLAAPDTGRFTGSLVVKVAAGLTQTDSIPLVGIGLPQTGILDVHNASLHGGNVSDCGGDTLMQASIANVGCDTLSITNIRVSGDVEAFTNLSSANDTLLPPNGEKVVSVLFAPHTKGDYKLLASFHSKNIHGGNPGIDTMITLDGTGLAGSKTLSTVSTIDVGSTRICEVRDTSVVIQNTGCDTLCVTGMSLTGTGFVLANGTPAQFCIADGERDTIHLRTVLDTTGHPATNTATLQLTSTADQPAPPIVLTREIAYPAIWGLGMSSADSAYAGEDVTYRIILHGSLPANTTALSCMLNFDPDLLQFVADDETNVSTTYSWLNHPGVQNLIDIAPPFADSILATFHFKSYQAAKVFCAVTLDSVTITPPQDCNTGVLSTGNNWSDSTAFTLRKACGGDLLTAALLGKSIIISGIRPNPASTEVVMSYSLAGTTPVAGDITMEDALGREVSRTCVMLAPGINQSQAVSLDGLPSGVYLLRASDGRWSSSWRVVKEQ